MTCIYIKSDRLACLDQPTFTCSLGSTRTLQPPPLINNGLALVHAHASISIYNSIRSAISLSDLIYSSPYI